MGVGDFSGFVFDCGESVYGDIGAGWRKTRCGGDEPSRSEGAATDARQAARGLGRCRGNPAWQITHNIMATYLRTR
jgi:hypothetical protein